MLGTVRFTQQRRKIPLVLLGKTLGCLAWAGAHGDVTVESVTIPSSYSYQLSAHLYGQGRAWVIFCHGAVFDKESWAPLCREVAARQATALAFDFHPWRDPKLRHIPLEEDIEAAVRFAWQRGAERVALVGGSLGASAMLRAGSGLDPETVDRYVFLSPALLEGQVAFSGEKLFVASEGEKVAVQLENWVRDFDPEARVVLVPGGEHAQHIFNTPQGPALTRLILDFLQLTAREQ